MPSGASGVRTNAKRMGPRSSAIHGGRLHCDADARPFDVLTGEVVASGSQRGLGGCAVRYRPPAANVAA